MTDERRGAGTIWGWVGALWGGLGVAALLGFAVWRLTPRAWTALGMELSPLQWGILVAWVVFMLVTEGYGGFQKAFAPRVAARCRHLRDHPTVLRVLTAPVFAMAFYAAPRRRRLVALAVTLGVVTLVVLVSRLDQPWRGMVDAGVVLGLVWGLVSLAVFWVQAMTQESFSVSPEVAGKAGPGHVTRRLE